MDRPIRRLRLEGPPARRGTRHGAQFRHEIRHYATERLRLATNGSWAGRRVTLSDALALAEKMLPAHERFDGELFEEMANMAAAAGISQAEAIIAGGFTDFVDVVRGQGGTGLVEEDDCTAVLVPRHAGDGVAYLAQTWDMHASATPYVLLLELQPDGGPRALVFTTTGCLGQIGMNDAGIAVGISNLSAMDGRVGVTWPFVVRKILAQRTLDDALACVFETELAGGRNFLLLDSNGKGYAVEAMPSCRVARLLADVPLVHTNHCLDEQTQRFEAARPADLLASSEARLAMAQQLLAFRPVTVERLVALMREPHAICRRPEPPHFNESSGAAILCPERGDFWACWGIPADSAFEQLRVESVVAAPGQASGA